MGVSIVVVAGIGALLIVRGRDVDRTTVTTTTAAPTTTTEGSTSTTADPDAVNLWRLTAIEHRDQVGSTFQFECPGPHPEPANLAAIWGTGTYTDDSAVCIAAVHSGFITLEEGGSVIIEMRPGQDAYPASTA
ncbi:MAG TPA: LCCL domain-containing protein, partial [Acidimicrobiales bacterium]